MLGELTVVEQRYLAVRAMLDSGASVVTRYGVDRRTLHRWLVRYANEGLGALADRSTRPDRLPSPDPPSGGGADRLDAPSPSRWGPRTILSKLRSRLEHPPSRSAIYRCLVRHRLISPKPENVASIGLFPLWNGPASRGANRAPYFTFDNVDRLAGVLLPPRSLSVALLLCQVGNLARRAGGNEPGHSGSNRLRVKGSARFARFDSSKGGGYSL
jgi:hypothetical protein